MSEEDRQFVLLLANDIRYCITGKDFVEILRNQAECVVISNHVDNFINISKTAPNSKEAPRSVWTTCGFLGVPRVGKFPLQVGPGFLILPSQSVLDKGGV